MCTNTFSPTGTSSIAIVVVVVNLSLGFFFFPKKKIKTLDSSPERTVLFVFSFCVYLFISARFARERGEKEKEKGTRAIGSSLAGRFRDDVSKRRGRVRG